MIQATKAAVVTEFHLDSLSARSMELDYFLMVFDKLSSTASLLAGFASSALMVGIPRRDNPFLVSAFLVSTGCALGCNLLVVIVATMCTMWGPGMALRGEDATAVDYTIFVLEQAQTRCLKFFIFGLMCYFLSSILVVWLLFDFIGSVIVSGILGVLILWTWCRSVQIYRALLPQKDIVSGRVKGNLVKNVGELMGDATLQAEGGVSASFATHI